VYLITFVEWQHCFLLSRKSKPFGKNPDGLSYIYQFLLIIEGVLGLFLVDPGPF